MDNVYGINIIPDNDSERVAALRRYQIINSHRETAFNSICELACELFSCPISHISFLDEDTEYIKAEVGMDGLEKVSRGVGFCSVAILQPEIMLIEDTLNNELFARHPYVTDKLRIRFYAAAPVVTPDGFVIGTMCLIDTQPRTMTEKEKQLLQKLARVVMEQTELRYNNISLLQQRDEFIAIASHEMRTPLTSLKAAIQLLEQNNTSQKSSLPDRMLNQASKSASKLGYLVDDLFETSRINQKTFDLERKRFQLDVLIDDCLYFVKAAGKFEIKVEGDAKIQLFADGRKIEQVLVNLVENAMKYAPDSPVITLSIDQFPGFIRISVTDKGPGIAPETLPHIFRRYFRPEQSIVQTGLGLGLYICAEVVKEHGGEIGVNSELGKGSSFWFTLPV
ncbi:MAG TPA: GAF domain-containing sensor histidine kinase [Mucilaginibacter sp.]|nr:GAF domain-containing sensor histidine kinase [Mucilaginibacter sp.]